MYFDVVRCPRHCPRSLVDAAVMFSYKYHDLPETLGCEVEFVPKDGAFVGSCEYEEEESMSWVFIYRGQYPSDIIRTVFHELTHIADRLAGRLLVSEDWNVKEWDGVTYRWGDTKNEDYNELPWEVNALKHEDQMFAIFKEELALVDPKLAAFLNDDWLDSNKKELFNC